MTTTECTHTNVEWLSGAPGVVVTLNGDTAARCLDCGATATMDTDDEPATLAHQWQSGRFISARSQVRALYRLPLPPRDTEVL